MTSRGVPTERESLLKLRSRIAMATFGGSMSQGSGSRARASTSSRAKSTPLSAPKPSRLTRTLAVQPSNQRALRRGEPVCVAPRPRSSGHRAPAGRRGLPLYAASTRIALRRPRGSSMAALSPGKTWSLCPRPPASLQTRKSWIPSSPVQQGGIAGIPTSTRQTSRLIIEQEAARAAARIVAPARQDCIMP